MFADKVEKLISVLDTSGGHIVIALTVMISGHFLGEKEWAAAGLGGLLVAMRGRSTANV